MGVTLENFLEKIKSYQLSVLIVEDSSVARKVLLDAMSKYTDNLQIAHDGQEGLQLFRANKYDLILTDIEMPNLDGIGMVKAIREENILLPIIAISSSDKNDRLIELINTGITAFILKPINKKLLDQQMYRILKPIIMSLDKEKESEELKSKFETIFSISREGIAILDETTKFILFNDTYEKMTGYTTEELKELTCVGMSIPEDVPRAIEAVATVHTNGFIEGFEKTCIAKDGSKVKVSMNISLMPDGKHLLISTRDITDAKKLEHRLNDYIKLVDEQIITSTTDLDGNITYVSKAFENISKYSKDELLGQNHRIIRHPDMPSNIYKELWETIANGEIWQGEIHNKAKDGSSYWVYASISPIYNEENQKIGYTAIRQDITNKKMIEELSITDWMTGLYNRRHFNELSQRLINMASRDNKTIGFLILDVDYFKQYNDTYGHMQGDEVLVKIAIYIY
ncbi:MAG: PAS domain S-box protein, partial [Campylobacteraceae bacterium]|nr:PAS domain S-box protein [Campylobacteraceae bacterium]